MRRSCGPAAGTVLKELSGGNLIITAADAEQALARALGRAPLALVEQALLELRLFGLAVEQDGRFLWAIPLLRDTLLAAEPELAAQRLAEELADAEPG